MKTKPILFSTLMVQAILNGTKTQTRRIVKPLPLTLNYGKVNYKGRELTLNSLANHAKYQKDDILWVRETFAHTKQANINPIYPEYGYVYKATDQEWEDYLGWKWKPSLFMPKEACRLFLKVTDVHVERLQDISESDARAEGSRGSISIDKLCKHVDNCRKTSMHETLQSMDGYQLGFLDIWADIHGLDSWNANPWVWVYKFKRCERPKNFLK